MAYEKWYIVAEMSLDEIYSLPTQSEIVYYNMVQY